MKILLTNDDGIDAEGIIALAEVFSSDKNNQVFVVAPDSNRSAFSHSLTIFSDISVTKVESFGNLTAYKTSGTPADCVKFAMLELLKDNHPDIIISGINNGPNLGSDIMYSGTVAAAFEAAYFNIPSIAVSLNYWECEKQHYLNAAKFVKNNFDMLKTILSASQNVININYPATTECKGVRITKTGINMYADCFITEKNDGVYRLSGMPIENVDSDKDCDVFWARQGYATITPLQMDRTSHALIKQFKDVAKFSW